ncbi:MAG: PilZ domain-containing protein [Elusimicrobiota bacterium]|nr:PilZ domain-containing protein [Elusimicrobiota bacterium]
MSDLFKRAHARFACDLPVIVFTGPTGGLKLGPARLLDLSLSGGYLCLAGELKLGGAYRLRLEWGGEFLDLPGRVVREGPRSPKDPKARHFGLVFTLSRDQEKALLRVIDQVRRAPEKPGEDHFLRNYWG